VPENAHILVYISKQLKKPIFGSIGPSVGLFVLLPLKTKNPKGFLA
jgi:hypothetical protein